MICKIMWSIILKFIFNGRFIMNKYEEFMEKSNECLYKAKDCLSNGELVLSVFYKNASVGFKEKARNLSLKSANGITSI